MPLNESDFRADASPINISDFRNQSTPLNISDFRGYGSAPSTQQPLKILSRSNLMLGNDFLGSPAQIFACDFLHNPQDGFYYILYCNLTNYRLAKASSPSGPWSDAGALPGVPAYTGIPQSRLILTPGGKWSFYYITSTTSGVPALYQTATSGAINSTYTQTSAGLLSVGGTGLFDEGRVSEVFVFVDQGGTWRMLYMGFDAGHTGEQVGMATASAPEGPWTKVGTTPIIPNGAAGSFDNTIDADPNVIYYNGVYYIFHSYGGPNDVAGAGCFGMAITTTTDWVTFTKRGIAFPPATVSSLTGPPSGTQTPNAGAVPGDCLAAWAGALWWPGKEAGDNTCVLPPTAASIYYTHFGKHDSGTATGFKAQSYQAVFAASSIFSGAALAGSLWTRVEAESGDSHLTKTGAWTTVSSGTTFNRGWSGTGFITSLTTGDFQTLTWTGQRARVWMGQANTYGINNILLDGVQVSTFDGCYDNGAETTAAPVIGFDTGDLPLGPHTLKIQVSGTHNASSIGNNIVIDCWEFM